MPRKKGKSRSRGSTRVSRKPRSTRTSKNKPLVEKTLSELQIIARSHGIPFGGLTRTQLIEKIIAYQ